jgi:hypothetical protein
MQFCCSFSAVYYRFVRSMALSVASTNPLAARDISIQVILRLLLVIYFYLLLVS